MYTKFHSDPCNSNMVGKMFVRHTLKHLVIFNSHCAPDFDPFISWFMCPLASFSILFELLALVVQ